MYTPIKVYMYACMCVYLYGLLCYRSCVYYTPYNIPSIYKCRYCAYII